MARNHQYRVGLGFMEEEMGFRAYLFINEAGGNNSVSRNHRDQYAFDVAGSLSDQFSSLSLLHPKPRPIPTLPSSLQPLRSNGSKADQRLYGGIPKNEQFYELNLSRIRKNESQQERAKVLERQEARLHKRGLVLRNCNVLKEKSVGTGVFHPLQRPATKTFNSVKKSNNRKRNQIGCELLIKERRGVMTTTRQEQQQKDECQYHLPSDMDFSKAWAF